MKTTFLAALLLGLMALTTTANAQTLLAGFEGSLDGFAPPPTATSTVATGPLGATEGAEALQFTTTAGGFQFVTSFGLAAALTDPTNETITFDVLFTPDDPTAVTFAQVDFGFNTDGTIDPLNNFQFTNETVGVEMFPIAVGVSTSVELNFSDLPEFPLTGDQTFAGLLLIVNSDDEAAGTWSFDNIVVSPAMTAIKGDADLDGDVDFTDIPAFIAVLQSGMFQAESDADCNGMVEFADIPVFIEILQAQ